MIDWMNPSDDILEARRVGYEEGHEQGYEQGAADDFESWFGAVRELLVLADDEEPDPEADLIFSLGESIKEFKHDLSAATERAEKAETERDALHAENERLQKIVDTCPGCQTGITPKEKLMEQRDALHAENEELKQTLDDRVLINNEPCPGCDTTGSPNEIERRLGDLRAENERLKEKRRGIICVWCGKTTCKLYPGEVNSEHVEILRKHTIECEKGPTYQAIVAMEKAEKERDALRAENERLKGDRE